MSLRLLHAIQTVNPASGGPAEGMRQLAMVNAELGHVMEAVCVDPPGCPWEGSAGLKVHPVGPPITRYGYSPNYIPWLREHASEYDCIIVNGIWGFNGFGTWLALRNTGIPYVVFTHGMLDPWFKRRYPLKHLKKWLYWPWGVYPLLRDADAVFFTCDRERLLARDSFWLYDCNEVAIHYGTEGLPDSGRDYRSCFLADHPALAGQRLFLFFGRVHPKKGPDLLLRAVARLVGSGAWDSESMRLVLAGPAEGDYARELKQIASTLGISGSLYWTGMVTGDAKWGALQSAEVFILPSHQENFGIAVAEALSASVPVLVAHPVNISGEIVADGAGFAEDDSVNGCVRMLGRWLQLADVDRAAMRVQARKTFEHRYTARRAARDLLKHIHLILAARIAAGTAARRKLQKS